MEATGSFERMEGILRAAKRRHIAMTTAARMERAAKKRKRRPRPDGWRQGALFTEGEGVAGGKA